MPEQARLQGRAALGGHTTRCFPLGDNGVKHLNYYIAMNYMKGSDSKKNLEKLNFSLDILKTRRYYAYINMHL
jgi:hypothetical protein